MIRIDGLPTERASSSVAYGRRRLFAICEIGAPISHQHWSSNCKGDWFKDIHSSHISSMDVRLVRHTRVIYFPRREMPTLLEPKPMHRYHVLSWYDLIFSAPPNKSFKWKAVKDRHVEWRFMRVVLLGHGRIGKTTLANTIREYVTNKVLNKIQCLLLTRQSGFWFPGRGDGNHHRNQIH